MAIEKKEGTIKYNMGVIYSKNMSLDVFGCKWFDETIVRDVVNAFFSPEEFTEQIVLRS